MMIVRRFLLAALMLSLLAIVSLVAALELDPGFFKSRLEASVGAALGRRLAIDGELRLELGAIVRIDAGAVRLANSGWGSEPEMLRVSRMVLELELLSLLRDTAVIPRIELAGLDVLLERNAQGQANWQFGNLGQEHESGWPEAPSLLVKLISMPGARLRYSGPRLSRPLEFRFGTVEQHPGTDGLLVFNASGQANDIPLRFSASVGPLGSLLEGKDIRVALQGQLGELTLDGSGLIDDLGSPGNTRLVLAVSGPDADYLSHHLGIRNLGSGPVRLEASVAPGTGNRGISGKLSGVVGELRLEGSGELVDPVNVEKAVLKLAASGPDLSVMGGLFRLDHLPPESFSLELHMERRRDSLTIDALAVQLKDAQLRVHGSIDGIERLSGSDLGFEAKGADLARLRELLHVPGLAAGPFELNGRLKHSAQGRELLDVTATTALGKLTIDGPLGEAPGFYGSELQFTASGADFAAIGAALKTGGFPGGSFDASGGLRWSEAGLEFESSALQLGGDRLELDGVIGMQPFGEQLDLRVSLQGKDPRLLTDLLGQPSLPAEPYTAGGRLLRARGGPWRLEDGEATIAGARLRLDGQIGSPRALPGIALNFRVEGPDLAGFSGMARRKLPGLRFNAAGELSSTSDAVRVRKLEFSVGDLAIGGSATLGLPLAGSRGEFAISATGNGFDALLPELGWLPLVHQRGQLSARGGWKNDRLSFDLLQLETATDKVSLKGELGFAPELSAMGLQLDAHISDLAAAGRRSGVELPPGLTLPASALRLEARISATPAALDFESFSATFGASDLSGRARISLAPRPVVDIELHADSLDLTPFIPREQQAASPQRKLLIPDFPLPLERLDKLDGRFALHADKLLFAGLEYSAVGFDARLEHGNLAAAPIGFANRNGTFSGQLDIRSAGTVPLVRLAGSGKSLLLDFGGSNPFGLLRYDGEIDLAGEGRSLRELATSLRGTLRFTSAGARLPNSKLNLMYSSFFGQLLQTLNPLMKREPYTDVICAAYALRAEGGVLRTDPALVIRTSALDIMSHGAADLRNESIDLKFRTVAREGLGLSATQLLNPYVKVSGTLAKPELTLDQKGTLISGGTAVATGGLSILASSVWDRFSTLEDPCASVIAEADRRAATAPH
ncbi:MAG: AsmA family protein [Gammaproteobacteria bacterium]|nr:AsmA family protein [Gammaproteobacteria bacterium]